MAKRILITGATGLLGQSLVRALSGSNQLFAAIHPEKSYSLPEGVNLVRLDLSAPDLSVLPESVDTVIYLAQSHRFREFPDGAPDMMQVNVVTPVLLAEWALRAGATQFVYASTGGVHGYGDAPFSESAVIDNRTPANFYIDSKRTAELLLRNFAPHFKSLLILRPFFIYGPRQNPTMLIPRLIRNVANQQPIQLNGTNGILINPIFVEDAARAVVELLQVEGFQTFNLAGAEILSMRSLVEKMAAILKVSPVFQHQDPSSNLIGDISKLEQTGFSPEVSMDAGIRTLVDVFV